ncbi:thiosulfate oxidation carrier complex protein SoxZ [Amphritea opalescens]|uniref:Thiosulfate oxidation carrier complex protein SoxZ n=1 Tax=Amphritea opalescens TaxID=2490544 RepID=A0A430KLC7_9GAMM|nr:thiosulfate oxidation carrier complex protein SoxZ [Amphritea opalescens]RTE64281.1 thiosulfate oxidation carrier complex protein SoxZ [Amphritea opalescens]
MTDIMTVKTKVSDQVTRVKMTANHPMHDGLGFDEITEERIPALFLQQVTVLHAGEMVFSANLSVAVASNPFLGFSFSGAVSGDELVINWVESSGNTGSQTVVIE